MKTPAGKECRYYYQDFHRGRHKQECRLLKNAPGPGWKPTDCQNCPVPEILWANASDNLELSAHINGGLLGLGRKVEVRAWCRKHDIEIIDPYVGCDRCAGERPSIADLIEDGSK
jgi:hypothetical protein